MIDTPITTPADALEAAARIADTFHAENAAERGLDPSQTTSSSKLIANLIRALAARIAAPVAVVKPLEWRQIDEMTVKADAFGCASFYVIRGVTGDWEVIAPRGGSLLHYENGIETQVEAKRWAQADYDARIRSALTIKTAAQPAAQAVAEAVAGAFMVCAGKARKIASLYDQGTDGRNTFEYLAEWCAKQTPADATAALARRDAEVRKAALREAAAKAVSFLVGDPATGVPLRNPMAHEIKAAILALIEEPAHE